MNAGQLDDGIDRDQVLGNRVHLSSVTRAGRFAQRTENAGASNLVTARQREIRLHQNQLMTVTRLFLVPHGATAATEEDRFSGSTGAELSAEGQWQAARLGERLSQQNIAAIYSSPLSRAGDRPHHRGPLPRRTGHT